MTNRVYPGVTTNVTSVRTPCRLRPPRVPRTHRAPQIVQSISPWQLIDCGDRALGAPPSGDRPGWIEPPRQNSGACVTREDGGGGGRVSCPVQGCITSLMAGMLTLMIWVTLDCVCLEKISGDVDANIIGYAEMCVVGWKTTHWEYYNNVGDESSKALWTLSLAIDVTLICDDCKFCLPLYQR